MLAPLQAEHQLRTIESVSVPKMKPDAANKLIDKLGRRARREKPRSGAEQLMGAMKVVQEPKKKEPDE